MSGVLSIDFETRSTVDLRKTGVYPYAQHPYTGVWCMAWAFDDEEPAIWTPSREHTSTDQWGGESTTSYLWPLPQRIVDHIANGGEIRAWNAQFERVIWQEIMVPRYGAPPVALEQWVCSAAEAAAMALPRHLGEAARVLGVSAQKDDAGHRLMLQMCRPRKVENDGKIVWWDVPAKLDKLYAYCQQDVRTERSVIKALRRLTPKEREVYLLDQRMNDRGMRVDRALVEAAQEVAREAVDRANQSMRELTCGSVGAVTNHGRLRAWLAEQGVATAGVSKADVRELLDGELDDRVRQVLEVRADAGRSSIAKLDSMLECLCADDRVRGLLLYHGASTGRWSGRLVQPQNFPRGDVANVEAYIPAVLARDFALLDSVVSVVPTISSMLRSMMTAAPGHELVAADYSAIEARVLNWIAGQHDIVALFRSGEDVYKHNAARLYNIPLEQVQKFPHRQTGKFQELGCGYGMGAKKAVSAAKTVYGLDITEAQAKEIVDSYRRTHAEVVAFWYETERMAIEAVENPGRVVEWPISARPLRWVKMGAYLYCILPSGRPLVYAAPKVVEAETPWGELKPQVEISAVDSFTHQWGRVRVYGGLLVENIVQAVSRDLMAEAMLRAEARGYAPVLTVHDEVVAEVPQGFGSVEEFESILVELPSWAEGCPVAAEGWRGFRYRK